MAASYSYPPSPHGDPHSLSLHSPTHSPQFSDPAHAHNHNSTRHKYQGLSRSQNPRRNASSALSAYPQLLKALVLPVIAAAYLSFCYAASKRAIPVATGVLDISPQRLTFVKSGITSISILVISLGLLPLKSLLHDLKSEEFFRTLSTRRHGVPLSTVNAISSPSFTSGGTMLAILRRQCSPYFTAAFIAGFLAIAVSTLAPAALSVQSLLSDGELMAFSVGAIGSSSVINSSSSQLAFLLAISATTSSISQNVERASSVAWAETALGVQYAFKPQGDLLSGVAPYIVPTPAELHVSAHARYLTDVVALSPGCSWAKTNISQPVMVAGNFSASNDNIYINFPDFNANVRSTASNLLAYDSCITHSDPFAVFDATTGDPSSEGYSVFSLAQCVANCPASSGKVRLDISGIETTFRLVGGDKTAEVVFLVCAPNAVVESREIRSDERGLLSVQPGAHRCQGNLHTAQTKFLLSVALGGIYRAGPSVAITMSGLRSQLLSSLIFGEEQVAKTNHSSEEISTWTPAPLANTTALYTDILQSTTKTYVSGLLGRAYVPGRISHEVLVFTASLPHVMASTVLLFTLSMLVVAAHFRSGKGERFTLSSVAAALDRSDLPRQFSELRRDPGEGGVVENAEDAEEKLIKPWSARIISAVQTGDGTKTLRIS